MVLIPLEKAIHRRAPSGGLPSTDRRYAGGQFIPRALWDAQKQDARESLDPLLLRTGDRLQLLRAVYDQNSAIRREGASRVKLVPLPQIEEQMRSAVRDAYDEAFLLGKRASGNLFAATDDDKKLIRAIRTDEYRYLRRFLSDMRGGEGVMDYTKRADYYVMATRELFSLGFVVGNQEKNRYLRWGLGPTEHCATCLSMAKLGWMPVAEFIKNVVRKGYLPQSGRLDCLGYRCQCSIVEEFRRR